MKKRVAILALAAAVVVGLAIALRSTGSVQRATLADGTELTLEAVTFGKEHRYVAGGTAGRFKIWLAKALRPLRVNLKTPAEWRQTTTNDAVTFLFRVRGDAHNLAYCVVDDRGVGVSRYRWFRGLAFSATNQIVGVTFENFPRRNAEILVLPIDTSTGAGAPDLAPIRFRVSNRLLKHYPVWQAAALPTTVRTQGIDFSLQRLITGALFTGIGLRQDLPAAAATLAEFQVIEGGAITTNWQPIHVEATDAPGDVVQTRQWKPMTGEGAVGMIFKDALWPEEPAWKLRFEFLRVAGFKPEELWVASIPDVGAAVAAGTDNKRLAAQKTFHSGQTVSVLGLMPANLPGASCMVRIRVTPDRRDWHFTLAQVTDETGRRIESSLYASTSGSGSGPLTSPGDGAAYYYNLIGVGDAKSLSLTLALHESLFAEFTAKAELVK